MTLVKSLYTAKLIKLGKYLFPTAAANIQRKSKKILLFQLYVILIEFGGVKH
jgi:hypothetical protein